jgi:hypothetical protein
VSAHLSASEKWLNAATCGLERSIRQRLEIELSAHYHDACDDFIHRGLPPDEASRKALENLGAADAARELYREQYAAEMPLDRDFLPKKPDGSDYGYVKGHKLVACTREELIERCKTSSHNGRETTLAWASSASTKSGARRKRFQ